MPKSALFVTGGWEGHQPKVQTGRFAAFLDAKGFRTELSDTLDAYRDGERLKSFDLIVNNWTMGELLPEQEKGLLDAVRAGTGLAGWHGGLCDSFRKSTDYQFMTGGQWVAHPGGIVDFEVRIVRKGDPITEGLADFRIRSEQYYMHVDPSNEVLATTAFDGSRLPWIAGTVVPAAWKRRWGEGKVFYSALGHAPGDFDIPEARTMVERGLLWAAR